MGVIKYIIYNFVYIPPMSYVCVCKIYCAMESTMFVPGCVEKLKKNFSTLRKFTRCCKSIV